jgi:multiple sugar transport system ATP-binding protein
MNLCTLPLGMNGAARFGEATEPLPLGAANGRSELVVGFRPEALELAPDGLPAQVEVVEEIGADAHVFCVADVRGKEVKLVARTDVRGAPERGARIALRPRSGEAHLFDVESGERVETG